MVIIPAPFLQFLDNLPVAVIFCIICTDIDSLVMCTPYKQNANGTRFCKRHSIFDLHDGSVKPIFCIICTDIDSLVHELPPAYVHTITYPPGVTFVTPNFNFIVPQISMTFQLFIPMFSYTFCSAVTLSLDHIPHIFQEALAGIITIYRTLWIWLR